MRVQRDVKPQAKVFACMCVALLLLLTACQNGTGQSSDNAIPRIPAQIQQGNIPANSSPIALQIAPHNNGHSPTPTTGTYNSGTSPGPVPAGNGQIPAAFPRYFSFGVMSPPAT